MSVAVIGAWLDRLSVRGSALGFFTVPSWGEILKDFLDRRADHRRSGRTLGGRQMVKRSEIVAGGARAGRIVTQSKNLVDCAKTLDSGQAMSPPQTLRPVGCSIK
ncbi:MAG: hypothetical protein AAGF23_25155, partial [Acidobacteriota bacterium]